MDVKVLSFVAGVTLFSYLEIEEHELIAGCLTEKDFEDKEEVVHEGDTGDCMYIIQSGKATVISKDVHVAKLSEGDYFGEHALIWDQPRNATVMAKGSLKVLSLTRERFNTLELSSVLHFPKRACIKPAGASSSKKGSPKNKSGSPKKSFFEDDMAVTLEEVVVISNALRNNKRLHEAMEFSDDALECMAQNCKLHKFKLGDAIVKQGDKVAESMYIVKEGELSITVMDKTSRNSNSSVGKYQAGDSFGELALLFDTPRAATICAVTDVVLYELHRHAFKLALRMLADQKVEEIAQFLATVQALAATTVDERRIYAEHMVGVHFEKDEIVFHKGEPAKEFMILQQGELVVHNAREKDSKRYDKTGDLIACQEFLDHDTYKADMKAGHDGCLLYIMDRQSFNTLLQGVEKNIRESIGGVGDDHPKRRKTTFQDDSGVIIRYSENDFLKLKKVRIMGFGHFGVVSLVNPGGHGCSCCTGDSMQQKALKSISKGVVAKEKVQAAVQNERKILTIMSDNPLIIHLYGTYKDEQHVYFLMEAACMDLQQAYAMNRLFGVAEVASYHIASLACALEALHVRRIAYRDVKPENLLLMESGRCKLCDMGIAKCVPGLTYTVVGTPEFCAPEVFMGQGYTANCDWWSLGVLVMELLTGGNPFNKGGDILKTMAAVKKGFGGKDKGHDHIPNVMEKKHPVAVELVKAICQKKPKSRLPIGKTGQDNTLEFRKHSWFKGIDWESIETGTVIHPPFIPNLRDFKPKKDPKPEELAELPANLKDKCEWAEDF